MKEFIFGKDKILGTWQHIKRIDFSKVFPHKMSVTDFIMMNALYELNKENQKVYVSDLASIASVSIQAISKKLGQLEEKDLITRVTDKEDRRNTEVTLTEVGKSIIIDNRNAHNKFRDDVFGGLSEEERDTLINVLKKLHGIIEEKLNEMEN